MFSERREIIYNGTHSTNQPHTSYYSNLASLLLPILQDPVSCGADGFLGDAHDAANVAVFQAHLEEDEEDSEATLYTFRLEKVLWAVFGAYFFWMRQKAGKSMAL